MKSNSAHRSPSKADIQAVFDTSPFIALLNIKLQTMDPDKGRLVVTLPFTPPLARTSADEQFHGGVIASLIDTAACFAIVMSLGKPIPTIDLRVDYLKPICGGAIKAIAQVRKSGKTIGVVDVDIMDAQGALAAIGRATLKT